MIEVRSIGDDEYQVKVAAKNETIHRVTLRDFDRERLGSEKISAEKLIEESFCFLLEREPNTSILTSFDLPIMGRYFPEYEGTIQQRLAAK